MANRLPPLRCCWIMTSSIGLQTGPESTPAPTAAVMVSDPVSGRSAPPVMDFLMRPPKKNWDEVAAPLLNRLATYPR